MAYEKWIDSNNPTCIMFTMDQSASMEDPFGGPRQSNQSSNHDDSKARQLANVVNRLLRDIVVRCTKGEIIKNYFDIGVIGYGAHVGPAWGPSLDNEQPDDNKALKNSGKIAVSVEELFNNTMRIEQRTRKVADDTGNLFDQSVKFPVWIDPESENGTPMGEALQQAYEYLKGWVNDHPNSFPPMVFNITDGEYNGDLDPQGPAQQIKQLATNDGNALLFNIHLSTEAGASILYPEKADVLPNDFATTLFEMSSPLPNSFIAEARKENIPVGEASRGFVFQSDGAELVQFLDLGTRRLMSGLR